MPAFSDSLERSLTEFLGQNPRQRGVLGYAIGNRLTVAVPSDANKFYVRLESGGVVRAYHRSRVSPTPNLPVYVQMTKRGDAEIMGVDWTRALRQFGDAASIMGIGLHSHARFSGMEFPIDPRLLSPLRGAILSALTVGIGAGFYRASDGLFWWPGTTAVDLTTARPSSGLLQRWVILSINATTLPHVLETTTGIDQPSTTPLLLDTLATLVNTLPATYIPLLAIRLRGTQTSLVEASLEALTFLNGTPSASTSIDSMLGVIDRILVDDDGNILVDDDGNVLLGDA